MDIQKTSLSMGKKLKELRENRGYSLKKLAAELDARYGLKITDDSLMAYEIDNAYHSKAQKTPNMKMRVDTLYCLADLYGVSLDFLLDKEPIPLGDPERRAACNCTGLHPEAISAVCSINDVLLGRADFESTKQEKYFAANQISSTNETIRQRLEKELSEARNGIYDKEFYASADLCIIDIESLIDTHSPENVAETIQESNDYIESKQRIVAQMALDGLSSILGGKDPEKLLSLLARYLLTEIDSNELYPLSQRFRLPSGDVFEEDIEPAPIAAILLELELQLKELRQRTNKKYVIE